MLTFGVVLKVSDVDRLVWYGFDSVNVDGDGGDMNFSEDLF